LKTLEEKLLLIAAALDANAASIRPGTLLDHIEEWDSMGTISVLAMLDKHFDRRLSLEEIAALKTVDDILKLMEQ
jgi:acyl carrier protein